MGIVSHSSAVVMSRESEDYGQGITNSAQSGSSNVSRTANASRKDCCLNFFRNGFRRHPSCMPSASDVRVSTSLETKKQNGCHQRDQSNLEMFMQPNNSLDKGKNSGCLSHKDEYELEFEVRQGSV